MNHIKAITIEKHGNGGRLGNQLHVIASTIGIANKVGAKAVFPPWQYAQYFKGPFDQTADQIELTHTWTEPHFHYAEFRLEDCIQIKEPTNGIVVQIKDSYLQSEKYWQNCRQRVSSLLDNRTFKFKLLYEAPNWQSCSVHFRFGDYIDNPFYVDLCKTDYYQKAIATIIETNPNTRFLICSDDKEKAKEWWVNNIDASIKFGLTTNSTMYPDDFLDFTYMSQFCRSNIISNSTFSHWASILNPREDKIVIAPGPDKWFTQPYMNTKDMYSEGMILL